MKLYCFGSVAIKKDLTYGRITEKGLGLFVHAEGEITYYLVVKHVVKIYTRHVSDEYTFHNP